MEKICISGHDVESLSGWHVELTQDLKDSLLPLQRPLGLLVSVQPQVHHSLENRPQKCMPPDGKVDHSKPLEKSQPRTRDVHPGEEEGVTPRASQSIQPSKPEPDSESRHADCHGVVEDNAPEARDELLPVADARVQDDDVRAPKEDVQHDQDLHGMRRVGTAGAQQDGSNEGGQLEDPVLVGGGPGAILGCLETISIARRLATGNRSLV